MTDAVLSGEWLIILEKYPCRGTFDENRGIALESRKSAISIESKTYW